MMLLSMILALSPPDPVTVANEADIRCMAILSAAANTAPAEQRGGVIGGVMFFYGRVVGRAPTFDIEAAMLRLVKSHPKGEGFEPDRVRCGSEMQARGAYLITMGKHIQEVSAAQ